MTKPRSYYVDPHHTRYYHVTSRCVRRAWLLGRDPNTGKNYDHRRTVLLNHLKHLTRFFAVDVMGYAIMSNHFHLVLRYDPRACLRWDDEDVARRWCATFNGQPLENRLQETERVEDFTVAQALRYHQLLLHPDRLHRCRMALGSLSRFMQHLKQPFAVWANHEDNCSGHFFETRFYAGVLLDQTDLLACMAYVDLNPVEAGMARALRQAEHTSVHERLREQRFDATALDAYLAPLWSTTGPAAEALACTFGEYLTQLNLAVVYLTHPAAELPEKLAGWMARLLNRERRRRQIPAAFYDYA